ncbi:MAG: heparan-alpha-glucosaminide N-acetyltransferase [Sterolibacterium sp.]|nr:heparan-alpha-glucosaminide N-acetyltransferase [Sterolibacterium sp.]
MGKSRQAKPSIKPSEIKSEAQITQRLAVIDVIRGSAILTMILYHFGFDLNYLGWIHYDINYDPRWLGARALILGTFLFTVGISLALAENQQKNLKHQLARIGKIGAAAVLVTAGSWVFSPESTIYFGTLHAIALMSLLLLLIPLPAYLANILGLVALGLGNGYTNAVFDYPGLAWLGLMTHKPQTEDYVPVLPWFGVCLIGYAIAKVLVRRGLIRHLAEIRQLPAALVWLGRNSLAIYLLHQPLLLGILVTATHLLKLS